MYGQIVGTGVGCMLLASLAGTPGEIFRILSFEYWYFHPGRVLPYITLYGYVAPNGGVILKLLI